MRLKYLYLSYLSIHTISSGIRAKVAFCVDTVQCSDVYANDFSQVVKYVGNKIFVVFFGANFYFKKKPN